MSSPSNLTARSRREVEWKIGQHDLDRTAGLETVEEDVDEIPALPTGNPNLFEVSVSLDSRERLECWLPVGWKRRPVSVGNVGGFSKGAVA